MSIFFGLSWRRMHISIFCAKFTGVFRSLYKSCTMWNWYRFLYLWEPCCLICLILFDIITAGESRSVNCTFVDTFGIIGNNWWYHSFSRLTRFDRFEIGIFHCEENLDNLNGDLFCFDDHSIYLILSLRSPLLGWKSACTRCPFYTYIDCRSLRTVVA